MQDYRTKFAGNPMDFKRVCIPKPLLLRFHRVGKLGLQGPDLNDSTGPMGQPTY